MIALVTVKSETAGSRPPACHAPWAKSVWSLFLVPIYMYVMFHLLALDEL